MNATPDSVHSTVERPSTTGAPTSGRSANGRFAPGNHFNHGTGRPNRWRQLFRDAVAESDFKAAVHQTVSAAVEGDQSAAKMLYERLCGRPSEAAILDRL